MSNEREMPSDEETGEMWSEWSAKSGEETRQELKSLVVRKIEELGYWGELDSDRDRGLSGFYDVVRDTSRVVELVEAVGRLGIGDETSIHRWAKTRYWQNRLNALSDPGCVADMDAVWLGCLLKQGKSEAAKVCLGKLASCSVVPYEDLEVGGREWERLMKPLVAAVVETGRRVGDLDLVSQATGLVSWQLIEGAAMSSYVEFGREMGKVMEWDFEQLEREYREKLEMLGGGSLMGEQGEKVVDWQGDIWRALQYQIVGALVEAYIDDDEWKRADEVMSHLDRVAQVELWLGLLAREMRGGSVKKKQFLQNRYLIALNHVVDAMADEPMQGSWSAVGRLGYPSEDEKPKREREENWALGMLNLLEVLVEDEGFLSWYHQEMYGSRRDNRGILARVMEMPEEFWAVVECKLLKVVGKAEGVGVAMETLDALERLGEVGDGVWRVMMRLVMTEDPVLAENYVELIGDFDDRHEAKMELWKYLIQGGGLEEWRELMWELEEFEEEVMGILPSEDEFTRDEWDRVRHSGGVSDEEAHGARGGLVETRVSMVSDFLLAVGVEALKQGQLDVVGEVMFDERLRNRDAVELIREIAGLEGGGRGE